MPRRLPSPKLDPREEAQILSRYLIGRAATPQQAERYAKGCYKWFLKDEHRRPERRVVDFALEHRWSLGLLEAACALLGRDRLLRKKLLLMAAILEADTTHIDKFLPDRSGSRMILVRVVLAGARGTFKVLFGIPIYLYLVRT